MGIIFDKIHGVSRPVREWHAKYCGAEISVVKYDDNRMVLFVNDEDKASGKIQSYGTSVDVSTTINFGGKDCKVTMTVCEEPKLYVKNQIIQLR